MKHGRNTDNSGAAPRDAWCTPLWLADALGRFDVDPCSNSRSHVRAKRRFALEDGDDGLLAAGSVQPDERVFVNPPYSYGQVVRWVRAYGHTRFCFLLRFDTSTAWFAELYKLTALVAIPRQRVNFEPPPGVKASSNVFPHALFFAHAEDAAPALLRACCPIWRTR